jgi:N-acetylated-alpha-linked acidic dipeptidase
MIFFLLLLAPPLIYAADSGLRGFPEKDVQQEREWEQKARQIPEPDRIRDYIRRISERPHHAGSPASKATAEYLLELVRGWGLDATIEEFEALLPWPTVRKLELVAPTRFEAKLAEPAVAEDSNSIDPGQLPTYNAYSPDGDITAPLVYVNYGVPEDYEYLAKQGVDVKGKIVLARYGSSWRGVKPKVAYEHGAVGCLIYSDPRDDGYFPGDVYPLGPFRPKDGVQRGSVMDMAVYPGDPLSPGWASEKGSRRLALSEAKTLQKIPVLPISYDDALPLLQSLSGPVAPEAWRGAMALTYHIGPGPATAHLRVAFDWTTRPIYNVIARIPGKDFPDQWVMYGNHHDAWVNGAADPASGLASLLETARSLAELARAGWKPRRTVMFAIWDAEEFGLIGSTEWAEKHAGEIDKKLVSYLNTDMNGKGRLEIQGSHTLETFVGEVLRDVKLPGSEQTLYAAALEPPKDTAKPDQPKPAGFRIGPLGSGSDYTAFVHHLGVASVNMAFTENSERGIYHSIYDSFYWYSHFDDTDYTHGRALSQVMVTSLLRLADAPLLPFEFGNLARTVGEYLNEIVKLKGASALRVAGVRKELERLKKSAAAFESRYRRSTEKSTGAALDHLARANELLFRTERVMLLPAGLPGREWFKHQIYAPGLYTGYGAKTLPGIREAAEAGRWEEANREADALAGALQAVREQIEQAGTALGSL